MPEGNGLPAIEFIDVHTRFAGRAVLRGVSFAVPKDRVTVLIGPSGVGKTTCLKHLVGLTAPDHGDILVESRSIKLLRKRERLDQARRFGVLLQGAGVYGSALWESMTVLDNVLFQLRAQREGKDEELRERAMERVAEVGLADQADLLPSQLSSGMRKRAAIARALVADPDFAVLDGFELGIDGVRLMQLCEVVRRRQAEVGGTYLLVTQDMEVAQRLADEAVLLFNGRVTASGPAPDVFDSDEPGLRQFVTGGRQGPLGMSPQGLPSPQRRKVSPTDAGHDVPLPLAAVVILIAITASFVMTLNRVTPVDIGIMVALWVVSLALMSFRLLRSGRGS